MKLYAIILILLLVISCKDHPEATESLKTDDVQTGVMQKDSIPSIDTDTLDNSEWTNIHEADPGILLDIRYATTRNFTGQKIYDCAGCFLRKEVAVALIQVQNDLSLKGCSLKIYDAYRPKPYQQKLWDIVQDSRYVARPEKGSMHNRGCAVDLTLVDESGNELDMGCDYDDFTDKAHHSFLHLPKNVIENRQLLKSAMEKRDFVSLDTEWWHYTFHKTDYPVESKLWKCE